MKRWLVILAVASVLCSFSVLAEDAKATTKTNAPAAPEWQSLFDGKTLTGWKPTNFGGAGEIGVENQQIILNMGAELTGITATNKDLPKVNYEVELDAMKIDGGDFFCGLTFPVKESFCSLIVGGWGGSIVGLSSLDGLDASENDTSKSRYFEPKKWFHIRLRVEAEKIQAWIGDEQIIDVGTKDRKISLRAGDIDLCKPLGIATWQTSSAIKNVRLRKI